jgi:hypothetical protein
MARGRTSRVRRSLVWGLAAFLALQAVLGIITDADAVPVRDPDYAFREKQLRELKAANPNRPVVVVLGTSRTMCGVNTKRLSQGGGPLVYNFGLPGAGPNRELVVWRRLLARGIKPDAVAIEVMPALHTHAGQQIFEGELNDASRLSLSEVCAFVPKYYTRPMRGLFRWSLSRLVPMAKYSPEAYRDYFTMDDPYARSSSESMPTDEFGWRQGKSRNLWTAEQRAKYQDFIVKQYNWACNDPRPGPCEPMLGTLLAEVKAVGIPVVGFSMPECRSFREGSGGLGVVDERVNQEFARHAITRVDARTWMPDDAFWDGHHMHPEAADEFTDRFALEILPPVTAAIERNNGPRFQFVTLAQASREQN